MTSELLDRNSRRVKRVYFAIQTSKPYQLSRIAWKNRCGIAKLILEYIMNSPSGDDKLVRD